MSKKKQTELTMDTIMKMTPEVFRDTVKAQPVGFNMNLANLLKMQFEQCNMAKNSLNLMLAKGNIPQDELDQFNKTIRDIYLSMQLIEDRYTIVNMVIEEVSKH